MFNELFLVIFYSKIVICSLNLTHIPYTTHPAYHATGTTVWHTSAAHNSDIPINVTVNPYDTLNVTKKVYEALDRYQNIQPRNSTVPAKLKIRVLEKELSHENSGVPAEKTTPATSSSQDELKASALDKAEETNLSLIQFRSAIKLSGLSKATHASDVSSLKNVNERVTGMTEGSGDFNSEEQNKSPHTTKKRNSSNNEQQVDLMPPNNDPEYQEIYNELQGLVGNNKLSNETANFIADCVDNIIWELERKMIIQNEVDYCVPNPKTCTWKYQHYKPVGYDRIEILLSKDKDDITKGNFYPGVFYRPGYRAWIFALCKLNTSQKDNIEILKRLNPNIVYFEPDAQIEDFTRDITSLDDSQLKNLDQLLSQSESNAIGHQQKVQNYIIGEYYIKIIPNDGILIRSLDGMVPFDFMQNQQENNAINISVAIPLGTGNDHIGKKPSLDILTSAGILNVCSDLPIGTVTLVILVIKKLIG